jgi:hypothetical protein
MKRGGPLKRTGWLRRSAVRLRSGSPPRRHTPLHSATVPRGGGELPVPADVRAVVVARSGGDCEIRFEGCEGRGSELSHRLARGAGGRHREAREEVDRASNLVHACWVCHRAVEARPRVAYERGLKLHAGADPAREYVWLLAHDVGEPVYLDDLGRVHPFAEAGP